MPLHDWTRIEPGNYHSFHQRWISAIGDVLNTRLLPADYMALSEKHNNQFEPDVLTLKWDFEPDPAGGGGVAVMEPKPTTRIMQHTDDNVYADIANRLKILSASGELVAVLEIVSPANKHSKANIEKFLKKTNAYLIGGVQLFVIDPFPPTPRDPQGLHAEIWASLGYDPVGLPAGQDRAVASYDVESRTMVRAYVEPLAVGESFRDMPLFLGGSKYITLPVQETYDATWAVFPKGLRRLLE